MSESPVEFVYKIISRDDWKAASEAGRFEGVGIDVADKFIHLSTLQQVSGTLQRYFAKRRDLLLVQVDTAQFAGTGRLRFEASDAGLLFPHLFDGGFATDGLKVMEIGFDEANESHIVPKF
jgi:uncharacterized protein (DUF952 family)